jgi:hypothetical protein
MHCHHHSEWRRTGKEKTFAISQQPSTRPSPLNRTLAVDEVEVLISCLSTSGVSDDHGRPLQGKPGVSPWEKVGEDAARILYGLG